MAAGGRGEVLRGHLPSPLHPTQIPESSCPPVSIGLSCRLSVLPQSEACVPKAALSSRSVRRLVLKDLWEVGLSG